MRHTIPKGKYMGIAFDGTSRLGEAINVCVRYISDDTSSLTRINDTSSLTPTN